MAPYRYAILKPTGMESAFHNGRLLGPITIGIEVTEPGLARLCGLGNIDPQHSGHCSNLAAIEAAIAWPLPPDGATLVTIRRDLDAIGAMAVLTMRKEGVIPSVDARRRIAEVARHDRFAFGPWPGRRPLPHGVHEIVETNQYSEQLSAIAETVVTPRYSLSTAVEFMQQWILTGAVFASSTVIKRFPNVLWEALKTQTVVVRDLHPSPFALVTGEILGGLRLGYRFAPIVIGIANLRTSIGQPQRRKITI